MMGSNSFNRIYHLSNNKELHNFYSSRTEAPKKSASIVEKLLEGEEAPPVNMKLFLKYYDMLCFSFSLTFFKRRILSESIKFWPIIFFGFLPWSHLPYYNIAFVNYIRIAAATKAIIVGRLLRLETLLDAGGEK